MNHTKRRYTSYRLEIGVQEQLMLMLASVWGTKLWFANKQTHAAILTDERFPLNYIKIFYRLKNHEIIANYILSYFESLSHESAELIEVQ